MDERVFAFSCHIHFLSKAKQKQVKTKLLSAFENKDESKGESLLGI